ncbi:MAG: RHS repeat-associated core domain-containing protein, partial [Phycisphaerales bacterium]
DIVVDDDLSGDSVTASHDHAGNMIDDGYFRYVYDAWNRLVKVQSAKDSGAVTFLTAEFDAKGRRIKKVVTNSGDQDGTVVYFYDGWKIIETRDGSGNLYQQFIHGTQYVDELVMMRVKGKGDLYVHQDANWNVIGLTDLGGHLVERYVLTPYGEMTVYQETGYGDYDEDYDVMGDPPSTSDPDYTAFTGACAGSGPTGACRILDLDFDGDVDTTDRDNCFMSLPHGLMRHPGRIATAVHQPFAHQGLLYEPELSQYQNRARQYDPAKRRFIQRDPLTLVSVAGSGTQDGTNLYQYVDANPHARLDPSGLVECSKLCGTPANPYVLVWSCYDAHCLKARCGPCCCKPCPPNPPPCCEYVTGNEWILSCAGFFTMAGLFWLKRRRSTCDAVWHRLSCYGRQKGT